MVQDVTGTRKGRCLGRWLVAATNDNRWSKMAQEQGRGGAWGSCLVEEINKIASGPKWHRNGKEALFGTAGLVLEPG